MLRIPRALVLALVVLPILLFLGATVVAHEELLAARAACNAATTGTSVREARSAIAALGGRELVAVHAPPRPHVGLGWMGTWSWQCLIETDESGDAVRAAEFQWWIPRLVPGDGIVRGWLEHHLLDTDPVHVGDE